MAKTATTTRKPASTPAAGTTPMTSVPAATAAPAPADAVALKRAELRTLEEAAGAAHSALIVSTGSEDELAILRLASDRADAAVVTARADLEAGLQSTPPASSVPSDNAPPTDLSPSQLQPDAESRRGGWVTVIGPVKGRRRIGRTFSAEPQSFEASAEELAQLSGDPLLAVTTGVSVAAVGQKLGRRMSVDDVDFSESPTVAIKVLGPTKGRRRAGFEFNASTATVAVTRDQLALILGDPELAVLAA